MAPESDGSTVPLAQHEADEGGPVKSFLEHLEDLRWVLIKSLVALALGFVVCLLGANWIVRVLTLPLRAGWFFSTQTTACTVELRLGTNRLGTVQVDPAVLAQWHLPTARVVLLELMPVEMGSTGFLLGLNLVTNALGIAPRADAPVELTTLGPAASFIVGFKVALYGGAALASPFILYFVGQFVFPALRRVERKYALRGLFIGLGMFALGVAFCYFVLVPVALGAAIQFSKWLGFSVRQWRAEEYISFVVQFMLGVGLGFQIPVLILVLVRLGVLDYWTISRARPYVMLINLVMSAILTPPDVLSQLLMAVPLQLLFEITVLIAWFWARQRRQNAV